MPELMLPPELAKALVASDKQIDAAKRAIREYEALGLDASAHKAVIAEAERLRSSILANHSPAAIRKTRG